MGMPMVPCYSPTIASNTPILIHRSIRCCYCCVALLLPRQSPRLHQYIQASPIHTANPKNSLQRRSPPLPHSNQARDGLTSVGSLHLVKFKSRLLNGDNGPGASSRGAKCHVQGSPHSPVSMLPNKPLLLGALGRNDAHGGCEE